jgi:hypothetical protein
LHIHTQEEPVPISLTSEQIAFLGRVQEACERGLSEPEIARLEELTVGGLRSKLARAGGMEIEKLTQRWVRRVGSGEALSDLFTAGEIVTAEEAVPA